MPKPDHTIKKYNYNVTLSDEDETFALKVIRTKTKKIIWDTSVSNLLYSDQLIQIATKLPSHNIYGFGENPHQSFKHDMNFKTWPMFARDQRPTSNKVLRIILKLAKASFLLGA